MTGWWSRPRVVSTRARKVCTSRSTSILVSGSPRTAMMSASFPGARVPRSRSTLRNRAGQSVAGSITLTNEGTALLYEAEPGDHLSIGEDATGVVGPDGRIAHRMLPFSALSPKAYAELEEVIDRLHERGVIVGYGYTPGGFKSGNKTTTLLPSDARIRENYAMQETPGSMGLTEITRLTSRWLDEVLDGRASILASVTSYPLDQGQVAMRGWIMVELR